MMFPILFILLIYIVVRTLVSFPKETTVECLYKHEWESINGQLRCKHCRKTPG